MTTTQSSLAPGRGSTSTIARDSLIYGLGSVAGKAAGLLVVPIFTRLLMPDEFGRMDVLNALVSAAILVLFLGTDVAALRLFFDGRSPREQRQLLSTWYALTVGIVIPPAIGLVLAAEPVAQVLLGSPGHASAIVAVGLALVAGTAHLTSLGVLRALGRPWMYAMLEGGALIANAILAVVLLVVLRADATSVIVALAATWAVAALLGAAAIWPAISTGPTNGSARSLLLLGLPLAPAVVATAAADFFHRAYLLGSAGAAEAGYYSLALRYSSIALLVSVAIQLAWQPHAFRLGRHPDVDLRLAREGLGITIVLTMSAVVLQLVSPESVAFIGAGQYAASLPAVALSLASAAALGLFGVVSLQSVIAKATRDVGAAVTLGVVIALALSVTLAPRFGATGTALAVFIGNATALAIGAHLGRRRHRIPFAWSRIGLVVGAALGVMAASALLYDQTVVVRLAGGALFATALAIEGTTPAVIRSIATGGRETMARWRAG